MLNKIKDNLERMNWLSISVLKFGLMLSCTLLIMGLGFQYYGSHTTIYNLPVEMGKIAIALFTEASISAVLIDYYVKKHGDEKENQ